MPGDTDLSGWKSEAIVETVDVYPTLCELAGLEIPEHVQGTSFKPAFTDRGFEWEDVAFSQYPRNYNSEDGRQAMMGYSMRTADYRLTRWVNKESGEILSAELYDHTGNAMEIDNLAGHEESGEVLLRLNELFDREYNREHE